MALPSKGKGGLKKVSKLGIFLRGILLIVTDYRFFIVIAGLLNYSKYPVF